MSPLDFCIWLQSYAIGKTSITQKQWLTILKKLKDVDGDEECADQPKNPDPFDPGHPPFYPTPMPVNPYINPPWKIPEYPHDWPIRYPVYCSVN